MQPHVSPGPAARFIGSCRPFRHSALLGLCFVALSMKRSLPIKRAESGAAEAHRLSAAPLMCVSSAAERSIGHILDRVETGATPFLGPTVVAKSGDAADTAGRWL